MANLNIEEKGGLRAQYKTQADNEREVRKVVKAKIGDYQDRMNALREWVTMVQFELEFWEEELKKLRGQYLEVEE